MLVAIFTYSLSISCGVSSIAVKGTELNAEKGLVTKCFQEIKFILSLSEILAKVAFYQENPRSS